MTDDATVPEVAVALEAVLQPEVEAKWAIKAAKRDRQLRYDAIHMAMEMHRISRDSAVPKPALTAKQLIEDADAFARFVQAGARRE